MKTMYLSKRSISGFVLIAALLSSNCTNEANDDKYDAQVVTPTVITDTVGQDSDDPAIWINPEDPSKSIVLGTDKGGSLFAFDLNGKIIKSVSNMQRLNNVDVEYGFMLDDKAIDIAVATDRDARKIRVFSLPDLEHIDGGGIEAFAGEEFRRPMGVAIYKRPRDGVFFAIVSRKQGPSGAYLWQYKLDDDGAGNVKFTKIRAFGEFSGKDKDDQGEIEAIAVDDESGYVYYSDELFGIRKYHADPDVLDANQELAVFGKNSFASDREGIAIYKVNDGTGYIIVSDQHANKFRIFTREGTADNPHHHELIKVVHHSSNRSDGSAVTNVKLNKTFPNGLFVAMSDDKTFQFYAWADIAGNDLIVAPNPIP